MHIILKFIAPFLLICGVVYYLWLNPTLDEITKDESNTSDLSEVVQTLAEYLPDYDLQGKEVSVPIDIKEVERFDVNATLAQSEFKLQTMISSYDQALSDPEARKIIERNVKEAGKEYKKAILTKMRNGNL
jgi:hypothetical protein